MKKKRKGTIQTVVFMVIIAAVVFGCFMLVQKRSKDRAQEEAEKEAQLTEAEKLIMMDIDSSYPVTAREVLRLYNRILQCIHNEEIDDDQIRALAGQLRCLFDDEFLLNNPYEEHVTALIVEVAEYDMLARTIEECDIESARNMAEWENQQGSFASLDVGYTLKEAGQIGQIAERFLLREQEDGRWKIVGWERVENTEVGK